MLVAEEVAGVTAGIFLQVVLVVVLGGGEGAGFGDFGDDRRTPFAAVVDTANHGFGYFALLW